MRQILVTAYAINPYKGSEDGMGWNMISQIAKYNRVIAVTRENNEPAIRAYLKEHDLPQFNNVEFVFFDLPYWMRFWKKGGRGALLYYYMWQIGIYFMFKKKNIDVDLVHNLNFHNDWTPSFLQFLNRPFVWGPVGHHPEIPNAYLDFYGGKSKFREGLRWFAKQLFWKGDPFLKRCKHKADHILAMNSTVQSTLNVPAEKITIIPSVGSEPLERPEQVDRSRFVVLSAGRFVALKGFDITIRAFAHFYQNLEETQQKSAHLILVGKGPAQEKLEALIAELQMQKAIEIIPWIERAKLLELYHNASAFLFPSHEGAGMVISEAMSAAVPVLCFDNCGPGEFIDETCGFKVPYSTPEESAVQFSRYLALLHDQPELGVQMGLAGLQRHQQLFTWEAKGRQIQAVYEKVLEQHPMVDRRPLKNPITKADTIAQKIVGVHLLNDFSGSPLVFSTVLRGLREKGIEIDLHTCEGTEGFLSNLDVQYYHFPYQWEANKWKRLVRFMFSQWKAFWQIREMYRQEDIMVYINTLLPFGGALAAWSMGKKVVYHIHEISIKPLPLKWLLKGVARLTAEQTIFVSDYQRQMEEINAVPARTIHNALSDTFIQEANLQLEQVQPEGKFQVLMLCSLKGYKGVEEFIKLSEKLPQYDFRLVLNASETDVNDYFNGRTIPPNLTYFPAQTNVHPFYHEADLLLNLSHPEQWVETFGMTLLEGMYYGLPCIAPPVGGPLEVVDQSQNGFLIDQRQMQEIILRIQEIAESQELYRFLSRNARKKAEQFGSQRMIDEVVEVLSIP